MDDKDTQIITILQKNAQMSVKDIARQLKLSYTATFMRINKLEREDVIRKYTVDVDSKKLNRNLSAIVTIRVDQYKSSATADREKLIMLPEVERIDFVSGEWDILIWASFRDMEHLKDFLQYILPKALGNATRNQTMLVLESVRKAPEMI